MLVGGTVAKVGNVHLRFPPRCPKLCQIFGVAFVSKPGSLGAIPTPLRDDQLPETPIIYKWSLTLLIWIRRRVCTQHLKVLSKELGAKHISNQELWHRIERERCCV